MNKKLRFSLVSMMVAGIVVAASAQHDSTQYVYGIPVTGNDTTEHVALPDLEPRDNYRRIENIDLPAGLGRELKDPLYKGWEKKGVFLDVNTKLYIVRVPTPNGYRVFGLDSNGKGVTYHEVMSDSLKNTRPRNKS
jgi:hypothetical protein